MRALLNKWEAAAPPLSNAIIISYDIRSSVTFFSLFLPFFLLFFSPSSSLLPYRCLVAVAVAVAFTLLYSPPASASWETLTREIKKREKKEKKKDGISLCWLKTQANYRERNFSEIVIRGKKVYSILGTGFSAWPKWEALSIESLAGSYCRGPCATSQLEALLT